MTKLLKSYFLKRDGAVAVEYALLLPVLMTMMMAMVDFASLLRQQMELDDLSRAAAQYVAQGGSVADLDSVIIQQSQAYQRDVDQETGIDYTAQQQCECRGGEVVSCETGSCPNDDYKRAFYTVTVNGNYSPIIPWPGVSENQALQGYTKLQFNW